MIDYSELKRLAEAALNDNGDYVALNDYGMAVPPAVVLDLIAEVEALHKDADRFRFIEQDASSGMSKIYGDDWLEVVDQLIGMGDKS